MSSDTLLSAKGIRKAYTGTSRPFAAFWRALFKSTRNAVDVYPVLSGVDVEVKKGETVGIMGRNGAGKTTLLGILGGIIQPTAGEIHKLGKIAALLGVSAGFNPNFSGRENAYLFCSIQGMSRAAADTKMSEIESFADLGRYFDLPVRTYSSGMQSRLSFACAVHVDADLVIIDETLAVGDANFRMKCYDRIRAMKQSGQSFLLVSHNQNLVANFCTRGIVLEGGSKVFDGPTFEAVEVYKRIRTEAMGNSDLRGKAVKTGVSDAKLPNTVTLEGLSLAEKRLAGEAVGVIEAKISAKQAIECASVNFGISNQHGIVVCAWDGAKAGFFIRGLGAGEQRGIEMRFKKDLLPGKYFVSCIVHELVGDVARPLCMYQNFMSFDVSGSEVMSGVANLQMNAVLNTNLIVEKI